MAVSLYRSWRQLGRTALKKLPYLEVLAHDRRRCLCFDISTRIYGSYTLLRAFGPHKLLLVCIHALIHKHRMYTHATILCAHTCSYTHTYTNILSLMKTQSIPKSKLNLQVTFLRSSLLWHCVVVWHWVYSACFLAPAWGCSYIHGNKHKESNELFTRDTVCCAIATTIVRCKTRESGRCECVSGSKSSQSTVNLSCVYYGRYNYKTAASSFLPAEAVSDHYWSSHWVSYIQDTYTIYFCTGWQICCYFGACVL